MVSDALAFAGLLKFLFIGNSYTFYNDLPQMLEAMARASDVPLVTGIVAGGGFSLDKHIRLDNINPALEGREAVAKRSSSKCIIRIPPISGPWSWVIMQEQSLRPLENPEKLLESAATISRAAVSGGARPAILATWARKDSPQDQPRLTRAIAHAAQQVDATVLRAGDAWEAALREGFDLYHQDGSHPNPAG